MNVPVAPARRRAGALVLALALLAAMLPVLGTGTAEAQATPPPPPGDELDIAFALDGSGSISSADWALQRDGFSAALQDPAAFPLDGSVRVSVVQWAERTARVEVPLTPLTDEASRDAVIAQIQSMQQLQGLTNPGDGLVLAANVLAADPRPDVPRTVCMSTDGTHNSGLPLGTAAAQAQAVGTDRYSVIGIQDGSFTEAMAHAHYGPHVFGGGTVSFSRNTTEFTSMIIGACVNDPVDLIGLEVNQAVQSWTNDVPLVKGKRTVVRAFVEVPAGADSERVNGRLHGTRNGVPLPGSPIAASNTGGSVLAEEDVTSRRAELDASLNFVLPLAWSEGTVELRFDGGGTTVDCKEIAGPDPEDCAATVTFDEVPRRSVRLVGVEYGTGSAAQAPSYAQLMEQGFRAETLMPVDRLDLSLATLRAGYTSAPNLTDVNSRLSRMRMLDLCFSLLGCQRIYYGALIGNAEGGLANGIPGTVASAYLYGSHDRNDAGFFRNVGGHEIGHVLGLHHAVDNALPTDSHGRKTGYCNERASSSAPGHPWFGTLTGSAGSTTGPLLSPRGDDNTEAWGLDSRFVRTNVNDLAVVDPSVTGALMGYCWVGSPQDLWPSVYEWNEMRKGLGASAVAAASADTTTGRHLLVSGTIDHEATPVTATLDPVLTLDGTVPTGSGAYTLRVFNGSDVVNEVTFDAEHLHTRPPAGGDGMHGEMSMFTVPVLVGDAAYDRIEVLDGNDVLVTKRASANAPTVTVTSPAAGSVQDDDTIRFAWDASDADGDSLVATVRYRPGDDTTWHTFAVDVTGNEVVIDRSELAGSDTAIFEVIVSDGMRATAARSEPFVVRDAGANITIRTPVDGDTFYSGIQPITMEATAIDKLDGELTAVTWSSDLNGFLGSGPSVTRTADTLSVGTHVLTASVTNSRGVTTTAEVTIEVVRVAPPPVPEVSFGSVRELLDGYVAAGRISSSVERTIRLRLDTAERFHDQGQARHRDLQLEELVRYLLQQADRSRDAQPLAHLAGEVDDLLELLRG